MNRLPEKQPLFHPVFEKYGGLGLLCLTPLSTIFQLYHESVLLMEETGVPGENH